TRYANMAPWRSLFMPVLKASPLTPRARPGADWRSSNEANELASTPAVGSVESVSELEPPVLLDSVTIRLKITFISLDCTAHAAWVPVSSLTERRHVALGLRGLICRVMRNLRLEKGGSQTNLAVRPRYLSASS